MFGEKIIIFTRRYLHNAEVFYSCMTHFNRHSRLWLGSRLKNIGRDWKYVLSIFFSVAFNKYLYIIARLRFQQATLCFLLHINCSRYLPFFFSFILYPAHSRVGRVNLMLRHSVSNFRPYSASVLRVEWRNSTPRCILIPERRIENIK